MLELGIKIFAVILSAWIATFPWLYPKYSLFSRNAMAGVEKIRTPRIEKGEIEIGYIERGETGFKEVKRAAELVYRPFSDISKIGLAWGPPPALSDFVGEDKLLGAGDNGVVYVEYRDGDRDLLQYRPWTPEATRRLEDLHSAVVTITQQRSQKMTGGLTVVWTTSSILVIAL